MLNSEQSRHLSGLASALSRKFRLLCLFVAAVVVNNLAISRLICTVFSCKCVCPSKRSPVIDGNTLGWRGLLLCADSGRKLVTRVFRASFGGCVCVFGG